MRDAGFSLRHGVPQRPESTSFANSCPPETGAKTGRNLAPGGLVCRVERGPGNPGRERSRP